MKPNKTPDLKFADWDLELPKTHNRVIAFEKQNQSKQAATPRPTAGVITQAMDVANPYIRARLKILTDYPAWRRNEIEEMERTGNTNNSHYNDFVHEVALLGDTYMPI